jgi:hypothetical protein
MLDGRGFGLALIRDCNNARAFDTLLRYRGGTLAELWRVLRTLKALKADQARRAAWAPPESPIEPEARRKPGDSGRAGDRTGPPTTDPGPAPAGLPHQPRPTAGEAASCVQAIEVGRRERPAGGAPRPLAPEIVERVGNTLLAGTALVPLDRRRWP